MSFPHVPGRSGTAFVELTRNLHIWHLARATHPTRLSRGPFSLDMKYRGLHQELHLLIVWHCEGMYGSSERWAAIETEHSVTRPQSSPAGKSSIRMKCFVPSP